MIRDGLRRYSIALPPELVADLDILARIARKHRSALVIEALEHWVANRALMHAVETAADARNGIEWRLETALEAVRNLPGGKGAS